MSTLVYVMGEPGAGKSTLMATYTAQWQRVTAPTGAVARDWLLNEQGVLVAVELGKRRGAFSGTDALPMAVIGPACAYLQTHEAPLILAEGARLANRRFLLAAQDAGHDVILVWLDHDEAEGWRNDRAAALGTTQNAAWVKGRKTSSHNLATSPPSGVEVVRGHPDQILPMMRDRQDSWL
jgi:hypothetical protein